MLLGDAPNQSSESFHWCFADSAVKYLREKQPRYDAANTNPDLCGKFAKAHKSALLRPNDCDVEIDDRSWRDPDGLNRGQHDIMMATDFMMMCGMATMASHATLTMERARQLFSEKVTFRQWGSTCISRIAQTRIKFRFMSSVAYFKL